MKKVAFAAILGTLFHLGSVLCQTRASRIAFLCEQETEVCTVNPDGSGRRKITRTPDIWELWPAWSPDGKKIAFATFIPRKLVMTDPTGRNETLLKEDYWDSSRPAWSPGGAKIAWVDWQSVNILNIVTGEEKKFFPLHGKGFGPVDGYRDPAWSPDGREIAFANRHGRQRDIYVMNTDGDQVRRLTNNPAEDNAPAWSPDGRKIAFYSNRDEFHGIFVMDADGANIRRLTTGPHHYPTWSPDGTRIAFHIAGNPALGEPARIAVIKANGQGLKAVADGAYPSWQRVDVTAAVEPTGKLPSIWGLLKSKIRLPQFYLSQ